MKNRSRLLLALIGLTAVLSFYALLPAKSPISPMSPKTAQSPQVKSYKILGFLPYWNYNKLSDSASRSTTDIAYFSLRLKSDGSIMTHTSRVSEEPGWNRYKKLLLNPPPKPLTLVFTAQDTPSLVELLDSVNSKSRAVKTITQAVKESRATGINIDFEPIGGIAPSTRNSFTDFISNLRKTLPGKEISIDVYPTAASRARLWDLPNLAPHIDYLVVMTYDYFQTSSDSAGPNAPLRGNPLNYDEDIIKNISEISASVPPEKILLGIPFYGYEWATATAEKYSPASIGAVASMERIDKLIAEKNLAVNWDRNSLTPYIVHEENGVTKQIYFDNPKSISLKLDLVRQGGLAGIAIWALGYEGETSEIWNTIRSINIDN